MASPMTVGEIIWLLEHNSKESGKSKSGLFGMFSPDAPICDAFSVIGSDRGVILLRKLLIEDIESVRRGGTPRAFTNAQKHDGLVKIDSFTGLRAKGVS